jgi:transcriptional regulator with XRE-family HTH domain
MKTEALFYLELGKRVRKARKRLDLTQDDLANLLSLNRTSITNIEKGKQRLLAHTLVEVANYLKIPVSELLPEIPQKSQQREGAKINSLLKRETAPTEREFLKSALSKLGKG